MNLVYQQCSLQLVVSFMYLVGGFGWFRKISEWFRLVPPFSSVSYYVNKMYSILI